MTTIDFYTHCADRFEVASKLVAKAWAQHGSVRVLTPDAAATDAIRPLPVAARRRPASCRIAGSTSPLAAETPIVVDHALEHDGPGRGARSTCTRCRRRSFRRFERLAEIVGRDEADAAAGRERWKFYKARGYEMRSHNLSARTEPMPTARELLEQADALMRRNRARAVDTEIPELTEVVAEVAPAPAAALIALDDVPELADAVEEIEIASIVELPDDIDESSGWLHHDPGDWSVVGREAGFDRRRLPVASAPGSDVPRVRAIALAIVDGTPAPPPIGRPRGPRRPAAEPSPPAIESRRPRSTPVAAPSRRRPSAAPPAAVPAPSRAARGRLRRAADPRHRQPPIADDWARWEALAEEIRMQVLQRIDIFTDTRLRKQLSAQLQPIVDRASVQMVETINEEVGRLLRAYIAEAIEREIEKWREATRP